MISVTANAKTRTLFLEEANVMWKLSHSNVLRLLGCVQDDPIMLVFEYMSHGSLYQVCVL